MREHVPQETRIHYIITNGGSAANIVPAFAEISLIARNPDANVLNGIWERIMKCAQAGALASETRMEFEQGTNYANVLPNDTLSEVLGRAMQKAGGYEYTPDERKFADEMQKTLGAPAHRRRRGIHRRGRCQLGGPHRAVHHGDICARRGRAHLAGGRVCRQQHRT
jgi:aminobenzoyl-glutamate utilization protein B